MVQNNKDVKSQEINEPFRKDQLRRSTRGKFLRLIRKRESKRRKKQQKSVEPNETASKVKFQVKIVLFGIYCFINFLTLPSSIFPARKHVNDLVVKIHFISMMIKKRPKSVHKLVH